MRVEPIVSLKNAALFLAAITIATFGRLNFLAPKESALDLISSKADVLGAQIS